jgi:Holliday junction resolvasome RuvABC DNA-binding subunit
MKGGVIVNNATAIGYAILALKELGYTEKQIKDIEAEMKYQMDMTTEERAEQEYNRF